MSKRLCKNQIWEESNMETCMETYMEERLRAGKGHWIRMGKSTKNRSGYMEMFSNCDFSYSSETASFRNTIAFKRLAHTDYFRTANQHAVRERHKRNGYENTHKKQIGKTTGERYIENYKRNALWTTVRRTIWKTSIEDITREMGMQTHQRNR